MRKGELSGYLNKDQYREIYSFLWKEMGTEEMHVDFISLRK